MGREIERKFLVTGEAWRELGPGIHLRQGYLASTPQRIVRIRTVQERGYLTIKGITRGATRLEFEYEIPYAEASELLESLCEAQLEKTRYRFTLDNHTWEVDEFHGANQGLIVAEIELICEEEQFVRPEWIGSEVTGDPRYYNSNLATEPYSTWPSAYPPEEG